jgi:hypothetical protein
MPFLPSANKRPIVDLPGFHRASVIASFKPDGDLIPLYFQVQLSDESKETYQVSVKYTKELCTLKSFCCTYEHHGRQKEVFLTYHFTEHYWVIGRCQFIN